MTFLCTSGNVFSNQYSVLKGSEIHTCLFTECTKFITFGQTIKVLTLNFGWIFILNRLLLLYADFTYKVILIIKYNLFSCYLSILGLKKKFGFLSEAARKRVRNLAVSKESWDLSEVIRDKHRINKNIPGLGPQKMYCSHARSAAEMACLSRMTCSWRMRKWYTELAYYWSDIYEGEKETVLVEILYKTYGVWTLAQTFIIPLKVIGLRSKSNYNSDQKLPIYSYNWKKHIAFNTTVVSKQVTSKVLNVWMVSGCRMISTKELNLLTTIHC